MHGAGEQAAARVAFAVIEGSNWGWTSPTILMIAAIAIAALALFVWVEAHTPGPLDDRQRANADKLRGHAQTHQKTRITLGDNSEGDVKGEAG